MKNINNLRQTGSFSVTDPFLTTFYYVEKLNVILRKNSGEGFEKSYVPLHGGRGGEIKNCQNHPYVINKWPLTLLLVSFLIRTASFQSRSYPLTSRGWEELVSDLIHF